MYFVPSARICTHPEVYLYVGFKIIKIRDKFALPRLAPGRRHGASVARQGAGQRRGANAA